MNIHSKKYGGLIKGTAVPDIGTITGVQLVSEIDQQLNEAGLESDEFAEVGDRYTTLLTLRLLSRPGEINNVPYYMPTAGVMGFGGAIPTPGQQVIVLYVGNQRTPIAIGGSYTWRVFRRLVEDGTLPELKPGEVFWQAAIRDDPMSFFDEGSPEEVDPTVIRESTKGARIYLDYKGRLILESRHFRSEGRDGAFVQLILGNPATVNDDESKDFNEEDSSNESYIALQGLVSSRPDSDPTFKFTVTQDGNVAFEFPKGYFGRAPNEGSEPKTTVEVDVENEQVIVDGKTIKFGRDAKEPAVLGDTLKSFFEQLIDAILGMSQATAGPGGPTTGPPFNAAVFFQIKLALSDMLSGTNKVE